MDAWRARLRAASRRHLHWGISLDRSATLLLVVAVESVRVVVLNALIERRRPGVFQPSIWRRRIRVVRIHATGTPHRTLGLENTKLVHTGTRDPEDANHQANLSIEHDGGGRTGGTRRQLDRIVGSWRPLSQMSAARCIRSALPVQERMSNESIASSDLPRWGPLVRFRNGAGENMARGFLPEKRPSSCHAPRQGGNGIFKSGIN
ncbi:hypothetical protein BGZ61DRAFT_226323 [Ilyonectria robusta]|uniref:uncharacterized protein n=1 Tax=Ilyonectria robusta TaxID=1079257 RepID=UPI001E8CAAB4|nr:uncharacterized protein BGZ61DRAFT_226323 [Ilyonectria robusta]KAH8706723.1 hypothetical protein BGZ61DRAFT_226323 [Ilyonectria robusta]